MLPSATKPCTRGTWPEKEMEQQGRAGGYGDENKRGKHANGQTENGKKGKDKLIIAALGKEGEEEEEAQATAG